MNHSDKFNNSKIDKVKWLEHIYLYLREKYYKVR